MAFTSFPDEPTTRLLLRVLRLTPVAPAVFVAIFAVNLSATSQKEVSKLTSACRNGDKKACERLKRIASEDRGASIRQLAVQGVTDQPSLAEIAIGGENEDTCLVAAEKIADQALLTRVALEGRSAKVRSLATSGIVDQQSLTKLLSASNDPAVREMAQWNAAVYPFAVERVQAFLQMYPNESHALAGRQILEDEKLINEIASSGPGLRFVLPPHSTPQPLSMSADLNQSRGRTNINGDEGLPVVVFGQPSLAAIGAEHVGSFSDLANIHFDFLMPCGDRSVFVIRGTFGNIQGDRVEPIRLVYMKKYGFVYLGGKGKILSGTGPGASLLFQDPSN